MFRIYFVFLWFSLVLVLPAHAQDPLCGSDEWSSWLKEHNPVLGDREVVFNQLMYNRISQPIPQGSITIPVVFHIMHNNGPENVPDSVVYAAVDQMNLRYQNAAPYYDSTGHPVNIQFCLASVDPSGNPTTGITRTVTPLTLFTFPTDDQPLKNLIRWSPDLYYNVWVVDVISGFIDGYSSFPWYAGQSIDGVVIEDAYIANSFLLSHETGHYCGLYHTFQYGCPNENCLLNGDQVCDTPPDNSSTNFPCMLNSCNTDMQDTSGSNPFTMDMNELPNYMDYTTCPISFSQGQCTRMEASVSGFRMGLFVSNGCGNNPGQAPPTAGCSFTISSCQNGKVEFSDTLSQFGWTSEWDFNNDGQYDTIAHQLTWEFPATGTYQVRLRVTGVGGQDSTVQSVSVLKGPTYNYPIVAYPQAVTDTILACSGTQYTFVGDPTGTSWLWSTGDTTAAITVTADSSMDISLVMTDSSGLVWSTQCTSLYLEVYQANIPQISYDSSQGYLCQGELLTLNITNYIPGTYYWWVYYNSLGWFNTGSHDTTYSIYPDPTYGNMFYVTYYNPAGCTAQSNILYVQPQFLPFLPGLQLYVNGYTLSLPGPLANYQWLNYGIPIPGANTNSYTVTGTGCYALQAYFTGYPACVTISDSVCFSFTGLDDPLESNFTIAPNPVSDVVTVSWTKDWVPDRITLSGSLGEMVFDSDIIGDRLSEHALRIDVSTLPAGVYILQAFSGRECRVRKVLTY